MSEQTIKTTLGLTPETAAEFDWLMSLALDGALDADELTRFDELLASHAELAEAWAAWQWIDGEFDNTPALTPPSGFVQRFELRLAEREKQRQQSILLFSAAMALVAIALVLVSTASVGAFVFFTQGHWVGEQVRSLALAYTSANLWLGSSVDAMAAVANTPQAQIVGALYALMMVVMVVVWVQLLHRRVRMDSNTSSLQME